MPDNASRRGAADLGMPLMIVAFLVIGGFLWWLSGQAEAERAAREVVEAEAPDEGPIGGEADVQLGEMLTGMDPEQFVGQTIRGAGYEVASMLGTQGFWVSTPSGNPFLVSWGEALMAEGMTVAQGDTVDVVGELMRMELTLLDDWTAAGTITENDRIVAEFATHYVQADEVQVTSGGGDEGGEGAGD